MTFQVLVLCGLISLASSAAVRKLHKSEDGTQFYIEDEQKFNWFSAWNECARENMSLIAINTFYKQVQIDMLLRKLFTVNKPLWIGGYETATSNRYEWASTGETFNYINWGAGQPKRGNNHCILFWQDFYWHDWSCGDHFLGFICEEKRDIKKKWTAVPEPEPKLEIMSNDEENVETKFESRHGALEIIKSRGTDKDMSKYKSIVMMINPKFESHDNGTSPLNMDL